eukprot:3692823-Pleurochrysis_carterae.AAC.1
MRACVQYQVFMRKGARAHAQNPTMTEQGQWGSRGVRVEDDSQGATTRQMRRTQWTRQVDLLVHRLEDLSVDDGM